MNWILAIAVFMADPTVIEGRVIGITDGDTLTVLVDEERTVKVRLHGVDAPEKRQDFGQRSKEHLGELTFHRRVNVVHYGRRHRDRIIGQVFVGDLNVNLQMVSDGFCWHDPKYSKDPLLAAAEIDAREAHRGLWIEPHQVPPWEWRKNH